MAYFQHIWEFNKINDEIKKGY